MMATTYPQILHHLAKEGHEIACHSNVHTWCNKMSREQMKEDTHAAVDALEQCIGEKVKGYRAPAFSITEKNPYAFEILAQNGIEFDSSIFPASRDFGGFPSFGYEVPTRVQYNGIEIKEYPIPLLHLGKWKTAYSGGGYFRLFPYSLIRRTMNKSDYAMTYFHINDLITEPKKLMTREAYEAYFKEPGTLINRYKRFIKSNIGTGDAMAKLTRLLKQNDFINITQADKNINWDKAPVKKL
jgi:peptidoglycan/xylan/chitin deacetylase (PgdA/CDA1 family)